MEPESTITPKEAQAALETLKTFADEQAAAGDAPDLATAQVADKLPAALKELETLLAPLLE